jgi:hypothetical protein
MRTSKKENQRKKKIKIPAYSKINKILLKEFDTLLEFTSPERLSSNIRNMFLLHIAQEKDKSSIHYEDKVIDFYFLLQFLDRAAEELEKARMKGN